MKIGIKSDFNCEIGRIKQLDVNAGQRQLGKEIERGQKRVE
jgi:hypothetical protein